MLNKDPFISTFHIWMELFMHRSMRSYMHYAREKGLSRSMIGTLFHLSHKDHSGVTDLSEHLGVSSAAASQMLERLVDEGMIQRSEDPDDRRMKMITLTEEGSRVIKESVSARLGWLEELAVKFTEEEKKQITSAMELIIFKAKDINVPGMGDCIPKES
jgi:DNA-binding MarR family transcriptional regulator